MERYVVIGLVVLTIRVGSSLSVRIVFARGSLGVTQKQAKVIVHKAVAQWVSAKLDDVLDEVGRHELRLPDIVW